MKLIVMSSTKEECRSRKSRVRYPHYGIEDNDITSVPKKVDDRNWATKNTKMDILDLIRYSSRLFVHKMIKTPNLESITYYLLQSATS